MRVGYKLFGNLLSRKLSVEQILPAAVAIIALPNYDFMLDPLLQFTFPNIKFTLGVRPPFPEPLKDAQKSILEASLTNENIWNLQNGNASIAKFKVGLPETRDELVKILQNL